METNVDSRGVPYDSPWYPHTVSCIRKACGPRPQECVCGGNELVEKGGDAKDTQRPDRVA
jgi:hypothetical protein